MRRMLLIKKEKSSLAWHSVALNRIAG